MAKKKKTDSASAQTSSGPKNSVKSVSRSMKKAMRRDYMADPFKRTVNQQRAIAKKKRVVLVEPNPDPNHTNKRLVRRVVLPYSKNDSVT